MKTIHKKTVSFTPGKYVFEFPASAVLLSCGAQMDGISIWYTRDPYDSESIQKIVHVIYTESYFDDHIAISSKFLGTVINHGLVYHIFIQ